MVIVTGLLLLLLTGLVLTITIRRTWHAGRRLQRVMRVSRGECPACGYSVAGKVGKSCAECGYSFTSQERRRLEGVYLGLARMRRREPP